jgi:hypothetical protein
MAYQVKTNAKGNAKNTTPGFTPAPTKTAPPINDVVSQARRGGDGYSQNSGVNNPSVIPAGTQKISGLAANIRGTVNDPALDAVIAGKPIGNTGPTGQEREISRTPFKTAFGHRNRSGE